MSIATPIDLRFRASDFVDWPLMVEEAELQPRTQVRQPPPVLAFDAANDPDDRRRRVRVWQFMPLACAARGRT